MKVKCTNLKCMGIMQDNLYHPYILSTLLSDTLFCRKAGVVHKMKKEGRMTTSFQHRLLRAATPPIPYNQTDGYVKPVLQPLCVCGMSHC